jgi:capsular exopolysaccharide synthesis family protein
VQNDQREDQYFGLAEILRIIGRRWRWVFGTVVVFTGLALVLSFQQSEKYTANVRLLLRTVADPSVIQADPNAQVPFFADRQLQNEIQVIQSADVRAAVEKAYKGNLTVGAVTATVAQTGADAVVLSVSSKDPKDAANLVNLYADKYVEFSENRRLDSLDAANKQLQDRLSSISEKRDSIAQPLSQVTSQLAGNPGNQSLIEQQAVLAAQLKPELDALDALRATYVKAQENLALSAQLTSVSVAQVLARATPPSSPVSPKPVRNGIIGFMAGVGFGLALALAREFLDQSIRTTDDLERTIKGRYPIIGVIPDASASEIASLPGVGDHSAVAEAFRALRTSVRFEGLDRPLKVIQITSGSAGEGKTTVAANLARMLAQDGHRVAVVCCDLRRPTIHELFGVRVSPGLADVVLGTQPLANAITQVDAQTFALPAGSAPPNPSELLGSSRAEAVIVALANEMDYVVIDTTPVIPVTDAIVVSRFVDATLLVVNAGDTSRNQLHQALTSLEQASAPIVGLVLNRAGGGDRHGYGYGYGYGYNYGASPTADPADGLALGGRDAPISVR